MKGYFYLTVSILTEIFATTMLKFSEGFTVLLPSIGVIVGYGLSFFCLSLCLKSVPLSLAYAIWSGAGTAVTAIIGVVIWNEAFHSFKLLGLILIIGGIVLLNSSQSTEAEKETSS